ncbi:MAG: glutathione S-transferase family protein [Immundisolibacteraceae bacterium]|nr:glutathione S-transferase family protein [Immundisolibacteraceae bacterium]
MKLYDHPGFPNPRRVRIFLAEKGIQVPTETIDVPAGEHQRPAYLKKNPSGLIPALETDSGEVIAESASICRYLEEVHPQPALMGETALQKASIDMWHRRIENQLFNPLGSYFHHSTDGLGDNRYRNAAWGNHNRDQALKELKSLDLLLAQKPFISGDQFSVADITALCAVDLGVALGLFNVEDFQYLHEWHSRVSTRPSAAA